MFLECPRCHNRMTADRLTPGLTGAQCPQCGSTIPIFDQNTIAPRERPLAELSPLPSPVDPQIEGYQILGRLGEGGMGIVYMGRQVSLNRNVAIKVLSPALVQDPSFLSRFDREVAALVRLTHPHIVTIFDRGRSPNGQVYYIMEYVEGEGGGSPKDLQKLITERGLDSGRTRELMLQIVQALGFAHREGIIHRDVKPSNILVDRHGFAKVADFGIACMRADYQARHLTMANASVGTAIYASPEQQQDAASIDHRSDIYSTGVMLYQMLTGEIPFAGCEPPSKLVSGLEPQWDTIVMKTLQTRPENRFNDMLEFETALKNIGQTSAVGLAAPATGYNVLSRGMTPIPEPLACSQCGATALQTDQSCLKCGAALWIICPQCSKKVWATIKLCPGCSADLQQSRLFEQQLRLGRDLLEKSRQGPPSTDCLYRLEEARLALAKAAGYKDDPTTRSLLTEAVRLITEFGWSAGEEAVRTKRLAEATYCHERVLEVSPGHAGATARLKEIRAHRSNLVTKAQQLFTAGDITKAIDLLLKAANSFEGDEELANLLAQYREKAGQFRELQMRIVTLAQQNRWCEVSQIIAELKQSGAPIKGLDEYAVNVQKRLKEAESILTAARTLINQGHAAQAMAQASRVIDQIADHESALEIVKLARSQAFRSRWRRRLLGGLISLTCITTGGGAVFLYVTERMEVQKAQQMFTDGDYDAAFEVLSNLPHQFFHTREVIYLQGLIGIKQYASEKDASEKAEEKLLQPAKRRLGELIKVSEAWHEQAKRDLADALIWIPADATGSLPRRLAVAQLLNELGLRDRDSLSNDLLKRATERGLDRNSMDDVKHILVWNPSPSLAEKVVNVALAQNKSLKNGLAMVRYWAPPESPLTKELVSVLLGVADGYLQGNNYENTWEVLGTARQIQPRCDYWSLCKKWAQEKAKSNPEGAAKVIEYMVEGEQNPERLGTATDLYVQLVSDYGSRVTAPPPEIKQKVDLILLDKLIGQAEQLMSNKKYEEVVNKLEDARSRYSSLFNDHPKAQDILFSAYLEATRESLNADLDHAEKLLQQAIAMKPRDKEIIKLRGEIADLRNKAKIKQHLSNAARATQARNYREAASQIQQARALVRTGPPPNELENLVKILITELCEQARLLCHVNQKRYPEALEKLDLALELQPEDQNLVDLQKKIKNLAISPETANISGIWKTPGGVMLEFKDTGGVVIECEAKMPLPPKRYIKSCKGYWDRESGKSKLEGHFDTVFASSNGRPTRGTLSATIYDVKTLLVVWETPDWIDGTDKRGPSTWVKQE